MVVLGSGHSIIRSARLRIEGGISIPNAFAVLRLTDNSNLEGRVTSEPVSEMGFFGGPGNYGPIPRRLWDGVGSVRAPFRPGSAGILVFVTRLGSPAISF